LSAIFFLLLVGVFSAIPSAFAQDADGIPDSEDLCPNEPENYNGIEDDDGCPDGTSTEEQFTEEPGGTFSAVELDQKVYTWTDKVYITIIDLDSNLDSGQKDVIGNTEDSGVTISTDQAQIPAYILEETGINTGIFEGKIIPIPPLDTTLEPEQIELEPNQIVISPGDQIEVWIDDYTIPGSESGFTKFVTSGLIPIPVPSPEAIIPEPPPEKIIPESPPEAIIPEPPPEKIIPVPFPEKIIPEPTPETIIPEPAPEKIIAEPTPETIIPEPAPEKIIPEPAPGAMTPEEGTPFWILIGILIAGVVAAVVAWILKGRKKIERDTITGSITARRPGTSTATVIPPRRPRTITGSIIARRPPNPPPLRERDRKLWDIY